MREAEARGKVCPFRDREEALVILCCVGACMAWERDEVITSWHCPTCESIYYQEIKSCCREKPLPSHTGHCRLLPLPTLTSDEKK